MLIFNSATGWLRLPNGDIIKTYSGYNSGRNNPSLEAVRAVGPIPRGDWIMTAIRDSVNTGKASIVLEPVGHNAFGRTLFRIHGDNRAGDASRGCIIVNGAERRAFIYNLPDKRLVVI